MADTIKYKVEQLKREAKDDTNSFFDELDSYIDSRIEKKIEEFFDKQSKLQSRKTSICSS